MRVCPIINTPEYNDLVAKVGADNATKSYINNDEEFGSNEEAIDVLIEGMKVPETITSNPTNFNDQILYKITKNRLNLVNTFIDDLKSNKVTIEDNRVIVGDNFVINLNTDDLTESKLEVIIDRKLDRYQDELTALESKLADNPIKELDDETEFSIPSALHVKDLNGVQQGITHNPEGNVRHTLAYKQAKSMQELFHKIGIEIKVVEDYTLPYAAHIVNSNGENIIVYNPNLLNEDTIYHEFGHAYIDLIGYNTPLIQKGIDQVLNTPLADAIKTMQPNLTQEQFEKEVLTTAIGTNAVEFINDPEALKSWNFWLNRLYRAISELLNKISKGRIGDQLDVAKSLAADMINGEIGHQLLNNISEYKQYQITEPAILTASIAKMNTYLNDFSNHLNNQLYHFRNQVGKEHRFTQEATSQRDNIQAHLAVIQTDHIELIKVVSSSLNYNSSLINSLSSKLNKYSIKIFDTHKTIDDLNLDEQQDLANVLENTRVFIGMLTKVGNLEKINESYILALEAQLYVDPSATTLEYNPNLTDEDISKLEEYIEHMTVYVNQLNTQITSIETGVTNLNRMWNNLFTIQTEKIKQVLNNPLLEQEAMKLDSTFRDITWFQLKFDSASKSTHPYVAALAKYVKIYQGRADEDARQMIIEYQKAFDKVKDANGNFNDKAILDEYNRIVREYDNDRFYKDLAEAVKDLKPGSDIWSTVRAKFIVNNTTRAINPKTNEQYTLKEIQDAVKVKQAELDTDDFQKWFYANFTKGTHPQARYDSEFMRLKDKYRNEQYDKIQNNPNLKNYYDTVVKVLKASNDKFDYMLPAFANEHQVMETTMEKDNRVNVLHEVEYNLPMKYFGILSHVEYIKIPIKHSGETTKTYETRALRIIEDNGDGAFKSLADVKAKNSQIHDQNIKLHGEKVSTDLNKVLPVFINSAMTYKYRRLIENDVKLALYELKTGYVSELNILGKTKLTQEQDINGNQKIKKLIGVDSKAYKQAAEFIKMNFYDQFTNPSKYDKPLTALRTYTSVLGIGFNIFAGVKNITYGGFMTAAETFSGQVWSHADIRAAQADYASATPSFVADINEYKRSSKNDLMASSAVNALIKKHKPIKSYNALFEKEDDVLSVAYARKIFESVAFFMQEAGEHMMQSTTMLAMLHSHRLVLQDNGKYRFMSYGQFIENGIKIGNANMTKDEMRTMSEENKEFKAKAKEQFETFPKAIDIEEFKDGYTQVKDEYKDIATTDVWTEFDQRVLAINHSMHGVYNKNDKGTIDNSVLGTLAMQYHRWIRPGWIKRFGTQGGLFSIDPYYNEQSQTWDIGDYKALGKFIFSSPISSETKDAFTGIIRDKSPEQVVKAFANILKDYSKFLGGISFYWQTMSPAEQAGAKRAMVELASVALLIGALIGGLKYRDKDDKNKKNVPLNFALYQLDAARTELMAFVPVFGWFNEGSKLVANPTATFALMGNILKFGGDILQYPFQNDESRTFQGGYYRDRLKILIHGGRLLPMVNTLQRVDALNAGQHSAYKFIGSVNIGNSDSGVGTGNPTFINPNDENITNN